MTLSHDVSGAGAPVLLLHSTICDRRMWDPTVPALVAAGRRVIRCDLPGFGESPVPAEPYDTACRVRELITEPTAIVGASGGGRVALEIAARWPQLVTRLVLLCTALPDMRPGPQLRAVWDREGALVEAGDIDAAAELMAATFVGPSADQRTVSAVRDMQAHAYAQQLAAAADPPPIEVAFDLAAVTAPALLVTGAHDLPDFRQVRLPFARHVELGWAGHLPSLERPGEVNRLLLDFLGSSR
nr:alpha/beta hydrolase [uncultured Actinoplanes sp.]